MSIPLLAPKVANRMLEEIRRRVSSERILAMVTRLVAVPSPTGTAGLAADALAEILSEQGFDVERPTAGHPVAPAVVARFHRGSLGRVIQFNGHLDTVHLPFAGPRLEHRRLYGSGSVDMKGGIAAAVEAMCVLRDGNFLSEGEVLLTAHDLHECPWGDGRQVECLIREGFVGDGVLIPEYLHDRLPVIGRGGFIWKAKFARAAPAIHEILRGAAPSLCLVAAEFVQSLNALDRILSAKTDAMAGPESLFVGQIHCGELFNQDSASAWVEGTRRWLPGTLPQFAEDELRHMTTNIAARHGVTAVLEITPMRDCFELDPADDLVTSFQSAHRAVTGNVLPIGPKPFIDDGNTFSSLAKIPAITHGPVGSGAHTTNEWVDLDDLERVAAVYALTAIRFCSTEFLAVDANSAGME